MRTIRLILCVIALAVSVGARSASDHVNTPDGARPPAPPTATQTGFQTAAQTPPTTATGPIDDTLTKLMRDLTRMLPNGGAEIGSHRANEPVTGEVTRPMADQEMVANASLYKNPSFGRY